MEPGTVLAARYRLDRAIGAGGMGQVWAARDEVLGRQVAVKVQAVDGGTSDDVERFRREARAAAGLGHPNVVTIFDAGIDGGTAFLVMELLPGPDLRSHLASRGVLSESEAVALAEQIAAGLAAAHAAGVVHRDIKPANVMFQGPGTVKILDFGIARLAHTSAARLTATNTLVGSTPYLSPEQVEGRPGDARSDIYALGCVLMTMLTGRPPFEGDHPLAVMHQHASRIAPRLRERRPEVSAALDQLVSEMLAKSPDERPATCRAVITRLQGAVPAAGAGPAEDSLAATRVMASPTRPLPAVGDVARPARSVAGRRAPLRLAAVAAGAVLLVVVAVALVNRPVGEAQSPPLSAAPSAPAASSMTAAASPSAIPSTAAAVASTAPSSASRSTGAAQEPTSEPAEMTLSQALAGLRAAVAAEAARGAVDAKESEELTKRVEELDEKLREGEDRDADQEDEAGEEDDKQDNKADKQIEDVEKYLGELTSKGELSADGAQRIGAALTEVRAAL